MCNLNVSIIQWREREFVRVLKVEHRFAFTRGKFQGKQKGRQNGALGLNHSLLTP